MMPGLSPLAALQVVVMTTCSAAKDDKVGIITNPDFIVVECSLPGDIRTVQISAMRRITYMDFIVDLIFFNRILKSTDSSPQSRMKWFTYIQLQVTYDEMFITQ